MKPILALPLLAATAVWAADPVPLDIKTGQWEYTVTTQMNGMAQLAGKMPALSPDQLSKMPPEQRAKMEAALKMLGGAPTTNINKTCIKQGDLAKLNPNANANQNQSCKMTLVTSSRSKQEMKMDCETNGIKQTSTVTIEAANNESIKFNMQASGTTNGQPTSMTVNGTGKWLGAACSEK